MQYNDRWLQLKYLFILIPGNNDPIWFIFFQIGWLNHQLVTGKRYTSRILKIFTNLEALTSPCFLDKKTRWVFLGTKTETETPEAWVSVLFGNGTLESTESFWGGIKVNANKNCKGLFFDKKCKETFIKWRIYWFLNFVMFIFFQKIKRCFCCFCIVFFQDPTFSSYQGSSARCHGWTAGGGDLRFQSFFKILPWISREDDPNSNDNMGAKNHDLLQTCVPFGVDLEDE